MKSRLTFLFLLLIAFSGCKHQTTVVESTYPDGSPRRVCVYLGKGETREMIKETCFYKNKKVQVEGEYKHGQRNGKWTYYYESGLPWSDGYFKAGMSDGKRTTYYPNGKIRYEAFYKEDKRTGIWKFYDESGKLVKSVNYSKAGSPDIQEIPAPASPKQ
jgi:antitoxin component YwqK of YwqJK toxin-antitoxin module